MAGSGAASRVTAVAAERLATMSRQWRPAPSMSEPERSGDPWRAVRDPEEPPEGSGLRLGSWDRPALRGLAVIVVLAVVVAAWWAWSGRPRQVAVAPEQVATGAGLTAAPPAPPPSAVPDPSAPAGQVIVHVVGQVKNPGLVTLPAGSRVDDALRAVGGVTKPRAADSVNLARVLTDGEQVVVGFAAQAVAGVFGIAQAPSSASVNLNSADASAFELLPGVGPVLAQRIVQWRIDNGPFRSVDELGEVSGIGEAILAQLRPLVTV